MTARIIRLLHVEDDPLQQRMIAHHLKSMHECAFAVTAAESEELAMNIFRKGELDLVLLDYQLAQGNGLHLLFRMREIDPIIPIIAISGAATSAIAAKLVEAGADDYFNKRDLKSADLAKSILASLRRADAVRKTIAKQMPDEKHRLTHLLAELNVEYVSRVGPKFYERLDAFARDVKRDNISIHELQRLHDIATAPSGATSEADRARQKLYARPLLLELLVRVYDDPSPAEE